MRVEIISQKNKTADLNEIQVFVAAHPHNTVFQSPAFFSFYAGLRYYQPIYFISKNNEGNINGSMLAVIIREGGGLLSLMSSRCVVYGGPLLKDDSPEILSALLQALNNHIGIRALFTQFRNFRQWPDALIHVFGQYGYQLRDRLNLLVKLKDVHGIIAGFSESRRRQLKKGVAAGAVARQVNSIDELKELYEILNVLYRVKVRKPLPDWEFFAHFYKGPVADGNGIAMIVEAAGKIIGGIVAPVTRGETISELYVCGLDQEWPNHYPSVVATWAAMDAGHKLGVKTFDFMGLGKPDVPYGVREFKLRFGGQQVNFGRFARRNNKLLYAVAELGYNVLRQLRRV
jgi:lipid II:glycine glycyltransferase (peptidoglycan interpeptide bridge formation enzyme)